MGSQHWLSSEQLQNRTGHWVQLLKEPEQRLLWPQCPIQYCHNGMICHCNLCPIKDDGFHNGCAHYLCTCAGWIEWLTSVCHQTIKVLWDFGSEDLERFLFFFSDRNTTILPIPAVTFELQFEPYKFECCVVYIQIYKKMLNFVSILIAI